MSEQSKIIEIFQTHILGRKIIKIDYNEKENLPTFHLDNEAYFKIEAYVSGADYDESVSISGGTPQQCFSVGGYIPVAFSIPEGFEYPPKKQVVKEILDEPPFQELIGCRVTGASGTGVSIAIELDEQQILSCFAYDYLRHKKYLYSLYQR